MTELTLPWPPSVNHYWLRNKNGSMRISAEGVSFRNRVQLIAKGCETLKGPVRVELEAWAPDRRVRDLDNICKATLDALCSAGVIVDDVQVWDLRLCWKLDGDKKAIAGMLKVKVMPL
jgi:crossover junction endodeoxyribonuclease RusA